MKRLTIADRVPGFTRYAEFFARLGGAGSPVRPSREERFPDGRLYVRYEVEAILTDGSWDGPHELLTA